MTSETRQVTQEPVYRVVWPLGKATTGSVKLSPPVLDLTGKTVGELWDWLFKGDEMFPIIRERLRQQYPGIKFVEYPVFGKTLGPEEAGAIAALPDRLREHGCDVVISGVGA